jgi:murein DD-endopeptidase MepM/ murein hydrolase activator NlpD
MRARDFIIEAVDMALLKQVAAASGISNPNAIKVGQKVKLPDGTTYTVVAGDSLGAIIDGRYKGSPPVKADSNTGSDPSQETDDDVEDNVALPPPPDAPEEPAGWTDSQGQPIRSGDGSQVKSGTSSTGSKPQTRPVKSGSSNKGLEPQIKPVPGVVTSKFGPRNINVPGASKNHQGVDLDARVGTPIRAPISGEVVEAAPDSRGGCGGTIAIANGKIKHRFCHCSKIDVRVGDEVEQGDIVGLTGGAKGARGAGTSGAPHLHWEKYVSNVPINPIA